MKLPSPIDAYFKAEQRHDADVLVAAFSADAVVRDEGADHEGRAAIRAWWLAAKAKYRHVAEPIETVEANGSAKIRARVTGDFPGSPAMLTFVFTLADDRISRLEIG